MTNVDTNTVATVNPIMAFKGHVQAMAFARKGGSALGSLLWGIAKRREEEGKGPIETLLFLETHYSDEEGHMIPVVGSQDGKTGNKPFDRYTTKIKTSDGERSVPGSWFTDVVKSTEEWASLNQRREYCKQGQGEGIPDDILEMSTSERAMEIQRIAKFITNMRTGLTKGAMLLHQCEAINKMNPDRVKVILPLYEEKGSDGKPVQVVRGNLIRLRDPSGITAEDEVVSVGSFLQYNAEKAGADPDKGTIKSLKATATKGAKGKGGDKAAGSGTNYAVPTNLEQTLTLFNVLASGIDQESDSGEKMYAALVIKASGKDKDAAEARQSIGKVCMAADSLWTIIRPMYLIDIETKAKAAIAAQAKAV